MDNICFECVPGGEGRPKVSFLIKNDLWELRELWTLDSHSVAKKKKKRKKNPGSSGNIIKDYASIIAYMCAHLLRKLEKYPEGKTMYNKCFYCHSSINCGNKMSF